MLTNLFQASQDDQGAPGMLLAFIEMLYQFHKQMIELRSTFYAIHPNPKNEASGLASLPGYNT